jgi:hypothetical protein
MNKRTIKINLFGSVDDIFESLLDGNNKSGHKKGPHENETQKVIKSKTFI